MCPLQPLLTSPKQMPAGPREIAELAWPVSYRNPVVCACVYVHLSVLCEAREHTPKLERLLAFIVSNSVEVNPLSLYFACRK